MNFVTVGTHEQQFDRLIKKIDDLVEEGVITDDVFIQTGYSSYVPKKCSYKKFYSYSEMQDMYKKAALIICHGGPSSFIDALKYNKVPIVVPRQQCFNEHINNHQLEFCKFLKTKNYPIVVIDDIEMLGSIISNYPNVIHCDCKIEFNNKKFCERLDCIISELIK